MKGGLCSGLKLQLFLRESPWALSVCRPPHLLMAGLYLRPCDHCMSTALSAGGGAGQLQTGGCHSLVHLYRNTLVRAAPFQTVH